MTFAALLAVAYFGLFLHWVKKRAKRQTLCNFKTYLLTHWLDTAKSATSIFAAIVALFASGEVELSKQTLAIAFGMGYTLDSTFNKTPEEE